MVDIEPSKGKNLAEEFESLTHLQLLAGCRELLERATDEREKEALKRAMIQITLQINPDDVDGLFGIRIAERTQDRLGKESCVTYALGKDVDAYEFHQEMFRTYTSSLAPEGAEYAVYFLFDMDLAPTHIGIVLGNGNVISKWGPDGHVYEHDPNMVPLNYGDPIFFIPPQGK